MPKFKIDDPIRVVGNVYLNEITSEPPTVYVTRETIVEDIQEVDGNIYYQIGHAIDGSGDKWWASEDILTHSITKGPR